MKNISPECKDTVLVLVLQGHFKGEPNMAMTTFVWCHKICDYLDVL
ncbi:hypothetical protein [Mariniflexile sp.]